MTSTFTITGMHCASCKALIEDVCGDIPGVTSSSVDAATGRLVVEHDASVPSALIRDEIERVGAYRVTPV